VVIDDPLFADYTLVAVDRLAATAE